MKWLSIPIPGECGLPVFGDDMVIINDDINATSEGSSFNFTCADATAIIRTVCSANGSWNPDPAHAIYVNSSANPTTGSIHNNMTAGADDTIIIIGMMHYTLQVLLTHLL